MHSMTPLRLAGRPLDAPATWRDGTHRAATLAATWQRFAPAMRRAGITRIAELTGLDTLGIPVFAAIRPLGRSLSTQQGKGVTPLAAKVSALMESLETWTAENVALPIVRGSIRALGARAVDVRRLPRALAEPADHREATTRVRRRRRALDRDARLRWVAGRDLATDEEVLVPYESVTLDMVFARAPVFDVSSNGLASGNVLVEAILHGLCEVIERDAEAHWRRTGGDRRIVLDSITDPACLALIEQITAAGARIFVWDLGCDVIPVVGCAIMEDPREPAWRALGFYQGFGAHLEPAIAVARAITEAAQTRLTYIAGARDDFFPADYARATDADLLADLWDRLAAPCDDPASFADLPRIPATGLGDGLGQLLARLDRQVIVVDLTHPQLRVPVVKVIVPGLATDVEALG
jgi:ribosomal protein S12 methylthiotransferase accessory factor